MNDGDEPNTGSPNEPAGTGDEGNQPNSTATPQNKGGEAAKDGDETVTMSKKDYNNLVAQRDRNHEENAQSQGFLMTLAKEREIDSFLTENKEKYPDLERDDLMHLDDPELLEATANKLQRRFQDVAQKKLENVQVAGQPYVSAEDKAKQLADLKKNPKAGSFERMVDLRTANN